MIRKWVCLPHLFYPCLPAGQKGFQNPGIQMVEPGALDSLCGGKPPVDQEPPTIDNEGRECNPLRFGALFISAANITLLQTQRG